VHYKISTMEITREQIKEKMMRDTREYIAKAQFRAFNKKFKKEQAASEKPQQMKTRQLKKSKSEIRMQKILQDCNANELEFPQVDEHDQPEIGDEVLIDGKKETGQRLMSDLKLIKYEDGIVTEITQLEPDDPLSLKATPQKVLHCSKGKKIEVFGTDKRGPYKVNNSVKVNGRSGAYGKFRIGEVFMYVNKGRISKVQSVAQKEPVRSLFKK